MKHSKQTIKKIDEAWSALYYIASTVSHSYEYELSEQLKYEKKERDSIHTAKALIMRETLNYYKNGIPSNAVELASVSTGILIGAIHGAAALKRRSEYEPDNCHLKVPKTIELMHEAADLHWKEVEKAIEKI